MKLLFIDTETGGLDPKKHSLLSVALGVWEEGLLTDTLHFDLIHDVYNVTQKAVEINKIDLRQPRAGLTRLEALVTMNGYLQDHFGKEKAVIVGQNVGFDIGFLIELYGDKHYFETYFSHRSIDTASLFRFLNMVGLVDMKGSGLDDALEYFGIQIADNVRHTALGDIYATAEVFNKLLGVGTNAVLAVEELQKGVDHV